MAHGRSLWTTEDLFGEFRRQLVALHGIEALPEIEAFTKWVPQPGRMTKQLVEENIAISLRRMDLEALDLLQFHWWDCQNTNYLDALTYLSQLRDEGKIKHLGLTNFDTEHLNIILGNGTKVVSNQVQYSLIDRRPEVQMIPSCQENEVWLLTYGTLCEVFCLRSTSDNLSQLTTP